MACALPRRVASSSRAGEQQEEEEEDWTRACGRASPARWSAGRSHQWPAKAQPGQH